MKTNRKICGMLFSMCFFFLATGGAQQSTVAKKLDYAKDPVWIKMMDDPNANYYEALKAYEVYWKHHEEPVDEEELMSEGKEKVDKEKEEEFTPAEKEGRNRMRYQCKRFENWKHEVFPFVQPDGKILSQDDRTKIWNEQKQQMKKQNQK